MAFLVRVLLFYSLVLIYGCTLTATRPVQEMSNASAAIQAAKELHADSLVPEIFRKASDYYAKAKHHYLLKNFSESRKYAVRTMRLAEQAEFEAYKLGGATPEISSKQFTTEGASLDTDEALKNNKPPEPEETNSEPTLQPEKPKEEKGTDYNEYVRQQEEEKARLEAEKARPKGQKSNTPKPGEPPPAPTEGTPYVPPPSPSGQTGPQKPSTSTSQNTTPTQTGAFPAVTSGSGVGQLPTLPQPVNKIDSQRWILEEDEPPRQGADIPPLGATSIPDIETTGIPTLGHDAVPETQGLDEMPTAPVQDVYRGQGLSNPYPEGENK